VTRSAPALISALALAACGSPAQPASAPANATTTANATATANANANANTTTTANAPVRRVALRFDLEGRPFPSPLADALIAGQPTTVLVDTGATHHVVAAWLAQELALPMSSAGDVGMDHAGQSVRVSRLQGTVMSLSGWGAVDDPAMLVVPVPDALRRSGIGAFVAPQALASGGRAVVLDLRAGAMTEAPLEDAVKALAAGSGGPVTELGACGGPGRGRELTAPATIEGVAVILKVDSGASNTSLFAGSPAGKRLAGRASSSRSAYAASGKHTVPVVPGARVQVSGVEISTDIDLLPNASRPGCPTDGFAGMDVLRGCVLVLGEARAIVRCSAR
jgi:predicted aspartyl protease